MSGDSNLYIARVLTFDDVTKDAQVLIPQLQGVTPFGAQAYINRYEELEDLNDLLAGDRVLVFFDGGDTNSQAYWMVVYSGLEGPPGAPGPPGPPGAGGGEIGDHVSQPDPHVGYMLETAMSAYYTRSEADTAFISPTEQSAALANYYNQTQVDNALLNYLHKAGGTMSGYIVLHANPTLGTHPATKSYVDDHINASNPHPSIQLALGANTTGNYVATIQGTANRISVSGSGSETAAVTLDLPQDIHNLATPTFRRLILTQPPGQPPFTVSSSDLVPLLNAATVGGHDSLYLRDWNNMYNLPDPTVQVTLSGAVGGSGSAVWTDLANNLSINITNTTVAGTGLNADTLDNLDSTFYLNAANLNTGVLLAQRLSGTYTINITGNASGNAGTATKLLTSHTIATKPFDGTQDVTLSTLTAGSGFTTASGTYNGSAIATFAVDSTAAATPLKIVQRDAAGSFLANIITGTVFKSTVPVGTQPIEVLSTTKVNNLNADFLDGLNSDYFANSEEVEALLGDLLYVGLYDAELYTVPNVPPGANPLFHVKPQPTWSAGPTVYRNGMYWVVSSTGPIDFAYSDPTRRYGNQDEDGKFDDNSVILSQGDWIIAANPGYAVTDRRLVGNVAELTLTLTEPLPKTVPATPPNHAFVVGRTIEVEGIDAVFNGTYTVTATTATTVSYARQNVNIPPTATIGRAYGDTAGHMIFQVIQFSAETFVKQQISQHNNATDPHPNAGFLRQAATDAWYAKIDHNHNPEIEQYVLQHTFRTNYGITQFSVAAITPTPSPPYNRLSIHLSKPNLNFYVGSVVSIAFPPGSYTEYNAAFAPGYSEYTVTSIVDNVITVNTSGPVRVLTAGPIVGGEHTAILTPDPHPYYLLGTKAAELYAPAVHHHDADIAAAITVHTDNPDPHPNYYNQARGDLHFEAYGAVRDHVGESGDQHRVLYFTKNEIVTQFVGTAALEDHLKHPDPHTMYLTLARADPLFSNEGHDHNDAYYTKTETVGLISAATPKNILATDGAASARVWIGDATPADPKPGDVWIQTDNVQLQSPAPPTALAAISESSSQVRISWDLFPTLAAVTAIDIQWSTTGTDLSYVPLATNLPSSTTSFTHTGREQDTRYWYRVVGKNNATTGPQSTWGWGYVNLFTDNDSPPVPTAVAIDTVVPKTATTFRLKWTEPGPWPDLGVTDRRYEVALDGVERGYAIGTNTYFDFTGLVQFTPYQASVRSVDRSGLKSPWSAPVSVTTTNAAPPSPGAFVSASTKNSPTAPTVTGVWTAAPAVHDFKWYEVQLTNDTQSTTYYTITTTALTWTPPELTFATAYRMRVRSVDTSGAFSTPWVVSDTLTTRDDVRITPVATGGAPNDVYTITWTGVVPATLDGFSGYEAILYRSGAVEVARIDLPTTATTYTWTNLSFGTTYYATLRVKRTGTAPLVGTAALTKTMVVDPVPTVTAAVSSTVGTTISVTVTKLTTEPTGFSHYEAQIWVRGGTEVASTTLPHAAPDEYKYNFTGLDYDTGYSVPARTVRTGTLPDSSWSAWVQEDSGAHPDSTAPVLPTNLSLKPEGSYGAWVGRMSWPGGTDHYRVQIDRLWSGHGEWQSWHNELTSVEAAPTVIGFGTGAAGQSMRFRARSSDSRGNWSAWVYSSTYTLDANPTAVGCGSTNYWRSTNGGEYSADLTGRPHQGYDTNASWNARGMFYYGNGIRNAVAGKTVTDIKINVHRYNGGGAGGKDEVWLCMHAEPNDPGRVLGWGAPPLYNGWKAGSLARDESAYFSVPSQWLNQFSVGGCYGFGVYVDPGKPYMVYVSRSVDGYQGLVYVYHYG